MCSTRLNRRPNEGPWFLIELIIVVTGTFVRGARDMVGDCRAVCRVLLADKSGAAAPRKSRRLAGGERPRLAGAATPKEGATLSKEAAWRSR